MAMVWEDEMNSISCVSLAVGWFGEDGHAIGSQDAGVDAGCKDLGPIVVDKLWYYAIGAMPPMDLGG